MIPVRVQVYLRLSGGAPGSTIKLFLYPLQSYQHTIVARGGFESMTATYSVPEDVATDALSAMLMCAAVASGPDGETIWEGFCTQVSGQFGQEQRSAALDGMANRVRCKYTTVLDTPGTTASISDTASQALYGIKDTVISVGKTTSTAAGNAATGYLRERKNPKMTPQTSVQTGDLGQVQLTLSFAGWYTAFDWLVTSNTSTTNTSTTAQITSLTATYNSTNAFFGTMNADVTASGISDTEFIEPDTTYKQKFEALLNQGNSSGEALAWGIYENRNWKINQWAGATPTTVNYRRSLGSGTIYDKANGVVQPWNVRPDAMYQVQDFLDTGPVSTAQDAAARFYVGRVSCSVSADSIGCTLEPVDYAGSDAVIARLSR